MGVEAGLRPPGVSSRTQVARVCVGGCFLSGNLEGRTLERGVAYGET